MNQTGHQLFQTQRPGEHRTGLKAGSAALLLTLPYLLVSWYCSLWSRVSERDSLFTSAAREFSGREEASFVSLPGTAMRMLRGGRTGGAGTRSSKKERKGTVIPAQKLDLLSLTPGRAEPTLQGQSLQKSSLLEGLWRDVRAGKLRHQHWPSCVSRDGSGVRAAG